MKRNFSVVVFLTLMFSAGIGKCDAPNVPEFLNDSRKPDNSLVAAMQEGEAKGHEEVVSLTKRNSKQVMTEEANISREKKGKFDSDEEIHQLVDQVDQLRSKVSIARLSALNTQSPRGRKKVGAMVVYPFIEGQIFEVHAGVDQVTDIELQPGEKLTNAPVSGDTVRWKVAAVSSGTEAGVVTHLIVKALEENVETNIIVTTDRRTYHLRALASDWYMPAISWTYPDDDNKKMQADIEKAKTRETVGLKPEDLNFEYEVSGKKLDWKPVRVFDDMKKTFVQMPKSMRTSEAPALFVIEEGEQPILANYRVKGDYYVVDRLFCSAELRVGEKQVVKIEAGRCKRSFWERLF